MLDDKGGALGDTGEALANAGWTLGDREKALGEKGWTLDEKGEALERWKWVGGGDLGGKVVILGIF